MKIIFRLVVWILVSYIHMSWADDIKIVVHESLVPQYIKLIEGRSATGVTNFIGMQRDLIELTLLMQAFERSNIKTTIQLIGVNSFERQKMMLRSGAVLMPGNLMWSDEIDDLNDVALLSVPILKSGSTVWGIYGLENNPRLKKIKSVDDIAGLTALTDPSWHRDVAALNQLKVKIIQVTQWNLLKKMLIFGRADFTLLPFPNNQDMAITWDNFKLIPVAGIKIGVQGERGYVISKKYPNALALYKSLNTELVNMLQQGIIEDAFQQAGLINNPKVKNWQMLGVELGGNRNGNFITNGNKQSN